MRSARADSRTIASGVVAGVVAMALVSLACPGPPEPPRHLLLISVDTLRADRVDAERMPRIHRLAQKSDRFERAWATAPFTLPSISTMLTGRDPQVTGIHANLARLPLDVPTLSTRLSEIGFATGAVVSSSVLTPDARLNGGFDLYDAPLPDRVARRPDVRDRRANATTDAALKALDTLLDGDQRVFLWVHYQDPHGPYTPPRSWLQSTPRAEPSGPQDLPIVSEGVGGIPSYQYLHPVRDPSAYRRRYDAETRYTDHELGRLLASLQDRGILDETVIVFTADHGESLGEQSYWFQHGDLLNEASLRIPLLIHVPGRAGRTRVDPASLVDVVPTLAALFGFPASDLRGRDLLSQDADEWAGPIFFGTWVKKGPYESHAILRDGYRFVRSIRGDERTEQLYRIPDEERDVGQELPERFVELRAALDAHLAALEPAPALAPASLSDEDREALRAMGYLIE
jgi:arylsulfatase A-like enzyme